MTAPFLSSTPHDLYDRAITLATRPSSSVFLDGEFHLAQTDETLTLTYPGNGTVTAQVANASRADVDRVVASARRAFESGIWARQSPRARGRVLQRFAELIENNREDLALLETLDMGKPVRDAYQGDVPKSAAMIRWYGEAADKLYDEVAPTSLDVLATIHRVPVGVVACITPWNFPLYQAAYKLGPALAAGNSLIIKPSELSPRSTLRVAELAMEAGLPPGVFSVVVGDGPSTGAALAGHPDIDMLAFTGSSATAAKVSAMAAGNLARLSIEAGGKSAHVILQDAPDLDVVAAAIADGICHNQGQVCSAGSRLIVHQSMKDHVVDLVDAQMQRYSPGNPFDPSVNLGAVASSGQLRRILGHIEASVEAGARIRAGGTSVEATPGGSFMLPTIVDNVASDSAIAQQEVFGPVLAVLTYGTTEEAIEIANGTEFGLGAAVWTSGLNSALSVASRLRAGQVWINNYDGADFSVPWGGFKKSGAGRDKSLEAFHEYTASTTMWIQIGRP